jgi:hypothetical protein
VCRLRQEYGDEKAADINLVLRLIRMGNLTAIPVTDSCILLFRALGRRLATNTTKTA